jgi:hypothetical protein
MQRIAPSAMLEARIAELLSQGVDDNEQLAELGRLGTRLVLQHAVEDGVTAFLSRAWHERTPAAWKRCVDVCQWPTYPMLERAANYCARFWSHGAAGAERVSTFSRLTQTITSRRRSVSWSFWRACTWLLDILGDRRHPE